MIKTPIHIEKILDMVPQKSSSSFHKVNEASCPGLAVRFNASVTTARTPRSDLCKVTAGLAKWFESWGEHLESRLFSIELCHHVFQVCGAVKTTKELC